MRIWFVVLLALTLLLGSTAALAQDTTPTRIVMPEPLTEIVYGGEVFEIAPSDGTVVVGFVESRTETASGATVEIIVFGHDRVGWRSLGVLSGEASGLLADANPGDVVTLSVIGGVE